MFQGSGELRVAESMGYGTVEDTIAINNQKLVIFWYEDLSEDCQKQLKQAKIVEKAYSRSLQGVKAPLNTSWKQTTHHVVHRKNTVTVSLPWLPVSDSTS